MFFGLPLAGKPICDIIPLYLAELLVKYVSVIILEKWSEYLAEKPLDQT
jgi:hypothetical protein